MGAKDMIGQSIIVGDILAYGVRVSNTGQLKLYEVVELIETTPDSLQPWQSYETHRARVRAIERVGWDGPILDRPMIRAVRCSSLPLLQEKSLRLNITAKPGNPGEPVEFYGTEYH